MKLLSSVLLPIVLVFLLAACARPTGGAPIQQQPRAITPIPFPVDTVVLNWRREGGIAGFCDEVTVFADGSFMVANCAGQPPTRSSHLNDQQMGELANWVNTFSSFNDGPDDTTATFPDQMFVKTIFKGAGTTQAGPEDIAAISEFASLLAAGTPPTNPGDQPEAAIKARDFLAAQLGISTDEITVVRAEAVEWSDSCLGLGQADEICAQMITPGYKVILEVKGSQYELHTDQNGENIRMS